MKRRFVIPIALLLAAHCGCRENTTYKIIGSGLAKTEIREMPFFSRVEVHGQGTLDLTVGPPTPLTIVADDNILPIITTTVADETLTICPMEASVKYENPLAVTAATPTLSAAHSFGSAEVVVRNVDNDHLDLAATGAGKIRAAGKATKLTLSIKGAATIDTTQLTADNVVISISGAGDAKVHAAKTLDVTIKGTASVEYLGDPTITKNISGVGSVEKR